ncbi:SURF1-domain-containing protein [Nadsonia fulvescens var. elongata DSM 6958]|uniref:SURF1-like protein n=1 Tax=Nadsonia fulvescens var. elongata DSM 6958 TaxID=857566 RepID=A0A1E3PK26_9ASCO|nr:SURF1-domain-containing protein [Nadsonia fulvescens var. elongata DSM 6958]
MLKLIVSKPYGLGIRPSLLALSKPYSPRPVLASSFSSYRTLHNSQPNGSTTVKKDNSRNLFASNSQRQKDNDMKKTIESEPEYDENNNRIEKKEKDPMRFRRSIFLSLIILMPIISFGLGTWQVYRLNWKTNKIAECEDRLTFAPLPLPPSLTEDQAILEREFEYRRVSAKGKFRHDQEMLVGPRMRDGVEGFFVVTPLERCVDFERGIDPALYPSSQDNSSRKSWWKFWVKNDFRSSDALTEKSGKYSTVLINRGWISKRMADRSERTPASMPTGIVEIECLIRPVPLKNSFTADSPAPGVRRFVFMDINAMAAETGAQRVYLEALFDTVAGDHKYYTVEQMARHGIPIGRQPKVDFRNTHVQYIITWYGLSAFTAAMLFMLFKKRGLSSVQLKAEHAKKIW